ncbi:MAG: NAD(P)/FAD-dependent oxidoreductase, partial [Nocardioides sp.]
MKSSYRVVVIGGGIVGCAVLYHLARRGWTDIALLERTELTAGSSWHAAGGFHAINADATLAALQRYTIELYPEIEAESGVALGLRMTGGIELAGTAERMQWLRVELDRRVRIGIEGVRMLSVDEVVELAPIVDPAGLVGGLFDPGEGNLDPSGATRAFAAAAKRWGADVVQHNRVLGIRPGPEGGWRLDTELGPVAAEHVVNAGGLWARRV